MLRSCKTYDAHIIDRKHVQPLRCIEEFKLRKKKNDKLKAEAKARGERSHEVAWWKKHRLALLGATNKYDIADLEDA
ncbi:hypothetical protein WN943_004683 [Citrus x changshan-huyou]